MGVLMNIFYNHGGKEHLIKMTWRLWAGTPEDMETRHVILVFSTLAMIVFSLIVTVYVSWFLWVYIFCIVLFFVNIFWFRFERARRDRSG